ARASRVGLGRRRTRQGRNCEIGGIEMVQGVPRASAMLLILLGLAAPTVAQAPRKAEPRPAPLGWDGRPVTRTCHADTADLEGLRASLVAHEQARIGFKNKIRHGVFSGGELSGGRIRNTPPASLA